MQYHDFYQYDDIESDFNDLSELDINKEINLSELITNFNNLFFVDDDKIYRDKSKLKNYLLNLRKITCRNLELSYDLLIQNNIHHYIFKILYNYHFKNSFEELDLSIIVFYFLLSMKLYGY